jgi:hypothetical protein
MIANTAEPIATKAAQAVADNLVATVNQTTNDLAAAVTNTANQVTSDVNAMVTQGQTALTTTVTGLINDHKAAVTAQIQDIADKVLANATSDPVTERYIILTVLGTLLLAGLIVLVAALLGNATANHYIGGVAVLLGAPLLSILKTGIPISKAIPNAVVAKISPPQ